MSRYPDLWRLLTQPGTEQDGSFEQEIQRRSEEGLRLIAWAMTVIPLAMTLAIAFVLPGMRTSLPAVGIGLLVTLLGLASLGARKLACFRRHSRTAGWWLALLTAALLIVASLTRAAEEPAFLFLVNAQVAVVLLIALASIPFKPYQVLLLGASIGVFHFAVCRLMVWRGVLPRHEAANVNLVFIAMLVLLATVVSINVYRQIQETHQRHQEQIRSVNEMRDAQCRVLLSDNAASMGRLAAALSHELNNPLAVLKSNLQMLAKLAGGEDGGIDDAWEQAPRIRSDLFRTSEQSVRRLEDTVKRMQRFTNLDRPEVVPVDLNALVRDVCELVRGAVSIEVEYRFDLRPLPLVAVRPQLLSAVFSALIQNAAEASGPGGTVGLSSAAEDSAIRIIIEDSGKGLSPEEIAEVMNPGFRVRDGRVGTCNWSIFGARQIVRQHGGDIEIRSAPGEGARVEVKLPA